MMSSCSANITCRDAVIADMTACAGILNRWIDATAWMPRVHAATDVERHYRETVFADRAIIVADREGEVVGFLAQSPEAYVTALYVDERHRRGGVGARLLREAKKRAPDELNLWTFERNADAHRFYEREGFVAVGRTDGENEEGLPDILYRWHAAGGERS
ncbi:GNAT family N-acetyltransferase [Sinorhizobium garamanticum]|uniref:GNAT family N-acetyltransferase n=1 Tax=Sinorhizobium garamanticum TaxID=680247 RepID=A0ABY8D6J7_9HYPH|nr:GNAT family N-acetyltransferase [Sinorhizobium garamanticum]WEX85927.1 GNAT family N-acetyltransferase [Sinorhizobium garamanticum]